MSDSHYFKFSNSVLLVPFFAVLSIWIVYWVEIKFNINLNDYGVYPRTFSGLKGIVFSPFIHGSLEHLYNNTLPTFILLCALFYFYRGIGWKVLLLGVLLSGLITWIIGRPSYHIGASGVIYVLASFIFFKGVFSKHYRLIALSLLVVFIYGSMLWYVFPVEKGISWEGHLGGFLTGMLLAVFVKGELPHPKKFAWEHEDFNEEEDPFLKQFDENGNFVELPKPEPENLLENVKITYHYKKED